MFRSLPVDQGIEHSAGASFAKNPIYFDAENIVKLAIEGGCNAVASTLGVLGIVSRKYAHKIPFIVKLNHNELLDLPQQGSTEFYFGSAKQAYEMGAAGIGATIYFGSDDSQKEIEETTQVFQQAHELGMFTVLWCYIRNKAFKTKEKDFHVVRRPDRPGQPPGCHHRGRHHQAEASREQRRLPSPQPGILLRQVRQAHVREPHPRPPHRVHPLAGCQLLYGPSGADQLGRSLRQNDFAEAVKTAVINKRAGGMGLISGRKAFQRPMAEGAKLLHSIQDVYLSKDVTIA